MKAEEVR